VTWKDAKVIDVSVGSNDVITAGVGSNVIFGGPSADTITSVEGSDAILGDSGEITFQGNYRQRITLRSFEDSCGIGGNDQIHSGSGDDIILGGAADDTVSGEAGQDTIFGDCAEIQFNPSINGKIDSAVSTAPSIGGVDTLSGDAGDDLIVGGIAGDTINGGSEDDIILGDNGHFSASFPFFPQVHSFVPLDAALGGPDTIRGGTGNDMIQGQQGNDVIYGED